jgi:hypothetical protein
MRSRNSNSHRAARVRCGDRQGDNGVIESSNNEKRKLRVLCYEARFQVPGGSCHSLGNGLLPHGIRSLGCRQ